MNMDFMRDFFEFAMLGECLSCTDSALVKLVPSEPLEHNLPLGATAWALGSLVDKKARISPKTLMTSYAIMVARLAKISDSRLESLPAPFLTGVASFIRTKQASELVPVSELHIDSSALTRLLPLAFHWQRNAVAFADNPPAVFQLIHALASQTVAHRRASLAAGFLIASLKDLLILRALRKKPLGSDAIRNSLRKSLIRTQIYYNSTYEYRGETGHFALLQFNKEGQMHLEGMKFEELPRTDYALDTTLLALWLLLTKTPLQAFTLIEQWRLPTLGFIYGAFIGAASGWHAIPASQQKRFKSLLES